MASTTAVDQHTGRKFYLEDPDDVRPGEKLVFLLNLHGGGSHGAWQALYFPAHEFKNKYRLVVATPSAATKEPIRMWVGEADDAHLRNIVTFVFDKYGKDTIAAFWLVGHSQGGMTSNQLLLHDKFFQDRVDGWLSLSGGRIGPIELPDSFFGNGAPRLPAASPDAPAPGRAIAPACERSFIFATGEHEMTSLPERSPWAERYGAGPRQRLPDIVDTESGKVTGESPTRGKSWGRAARPGTAEIYIYPNARDGRVIADIVRLDKGHTEGLEPNITEKLIKLVVQAPGGKAQAAS